MINQIFQNIRQRTEYISEVQSHVLNVLRSFQKDALKQGVDISIEAVDPDVTGGYLELEEVGTTQKSRVTVEINSLGEVRILRAFSDRSSVEETQDYETRPLDLNMPPISAATNVLLAIADDHSGFVGTSLETFLETRVFGSAQAPQQPFDPVPS